MHPYADDPAFVDPDAWPRVVSRAEAMRRGLSRHAIDRRLSSGRWRRVLPRTYLTADTFSGVDRLYAALAFAGGGAALSGAAALYASEVRGVGVPGRVLVLVPAGNYTKSTGWVLVRRSARPFAVQNWYGPRRVEVPRATVDLAVAMRRLDDVRALLARVVQDGHCTVADLDAELEAGPRRGSAHLRRSLAEVGWGAASAPEARAASILRRAGVSGFVQNAGIRLPDGRARYVDFFWPQLRACLEIDSVEWHFGQREWADTWDRHLELTKMGYSVIHRPPSALDDEERFVRDVLEWLAARAAELRGQPSA
jgi:hypothetical protein